MVIPTCYTIDFKDRWHNLLITEAKLSEKEYQQYEKSLFNLTQFAFKKCKECYAEMDAIDERFLRIANAPLQPLDKIYTLMQTCKVGTLNFSHLARCGFIASSFLKSFVAKGIISEEEKSFLIGSLKIYAMDCIRAKISNVYFHSLLSKGKNIIVLFKALNYHH